MPPHSPLQPGLPLIAPDTPLRACVLMLEVGQREFASWPRRNVTAVALLDGQAPCGLPLSQAQGRLWSRIQGHERVYTLLCLN